MKVSKTGSGMVEHGGWAGAHPGKQKLSTFAVIRSFRRACGNAQAMADEYASPDWRRRGGLFERRLVVQRYPARVILIVIILIS